MGMNGSKDGGVLIENDPRMIDKKYQKLAIYGLIYAIVGIVLNPLSGGFILVIAVPDYSGILIMLLMILGISMGIMG